MQIFIQNYHDIKIVDVHPFQSLHSILLQTFPDLSLDQIFLTYQSQKIDDFTLSCDALCIQKDDTLYIHHRCEGGGIGDFFRFFKKHWGFVILGLIIAVLPLFTLPSGMISISASLLKIVFDESFEKIGIYLVSNFGKYTLYQRFKFIISIFKYLIFILITYVSITFPLLVLTSIMKGSYIFDDPMKICSSSNAAYITGLILTTLYMMIYAYFRGFGNLLDWIKSFFQSNQTLQMTAAPMTEGIRKSYDQVKYIAVSKSPLVGFYYQFLDKTADFSMAFINSLVDIGCKTGEEWSTTSFMNKFEKQMDKMNESKKNGMIQIEIPQHTKVECCQPKNYFKIGKLLYSVLNQPKYSLILEEYDVYTSCIMIAISFLEKAYTVEGSNHNEIQKYLFYLEQKLQEFSSRHHQTYIPSNYGFWNHFLKAFFFYSICNVFTFLQNTNVTIQEMGGIYDVIDILKAGSATGYYMSYLYLICLIALFICGIFDIY